MNCTRKRLVLAGGGHAHLSVLRALARQRPDIDAVMITPSTHQTYSGMLPGWMAGHYSMAECQIDLRPLAQAANAEMILDQVTGVNADLQRVTLANGTQLDYDMLSVDVGGETNLSWLETLGKRLLPVKPLGGFVQRWQGIVADAKKQNNFSLIVVGGGAAGVEIALAAQHVIEEQASLATVALIASERGLLPGHAAGVSNRVRYLLKQRGIALHEAQAVGAEDGILLGNGRHLYADTVVAATGSTPPRWLQTSHLALDEHGYISVDSAHRSISHPNVFAAGDVCARTDILMARSGVHAVFAGPVVAHNLIASITGGKFISYRPRKRSLYLMATGPKHAIASWGSFSATGHWVWRWKNQIDRRFMNKHKSGDSRYD
ncbi:NADH oxidase [mine drainage metagenome]|uniref:NADH oxidase n=1 Tax=mine drainage metagenome TaxID=410659 RepID=A0A1J5RPD3_9ZZZZ